MRASGSSFGSIAQVCSAKLNQVLNYH